MRPEGSVSVRPGVADAHPRRRSSTWRIVSAAEALAAVLAVALDLLIPSLVLLAMAAVSLTVRRERLSSLGLRTVGGARLVVEMLGFAVVWSLFQLGVTLPLANHVSGHQQDFSAFASLQGNPGMLAAMVLLGWTLGALGEEVAYRGYLLTRLGEAVGGRRLGWTVAAVLSSVVFGYAHSEQGLIGVLVVTLDGLAWSVLRWRHGTLWAPVLAHGFNNTLGLVAFFLVGPVHGLW